MTFSLIIPTYREAENIPHLLKAIQETSFDQRAFEVILVDDNSEDGTTELVSHLQPTYPFVKLITRQGPRSLSQSVLDGFRAATYPQLVVMDADLSHPLEKIPQLLKPLEDGSADMTMGSRYVPGGSVDPAWSFSRKMISRASALTTQTILPIGVKDPLSGFFAINKAQYLAGSNIQATGWKIGLELLMKCRCKKIVEIPIHFQDRKYGKSKLTFKIAGAFLKQLIQLRF